MLAVKNLTKVFKGFRTRFTAIEDLCFEVREGEIFGFLGPNGAGKTTTIKIISGISKPTSGEVKIKGFDMVKESTPAKKHLGILPEVLGFYDEMSGLDLLCFYAEFYISQKSERLKKSKELLEFFGLEEFENKKVKTYSYGMKKRLALCSALINDPELLILDEPTGGLDPQGIYSFRTIIQHLHSEGITVFLSSHVLSEVQQLCSRVCILNKGRIVAIDTVKNLSDRIIAKTNIFIDIEAEGITEDVTEEIKKFQFVVEVNKTATGINVVSEKDISAEINALIVKRGIKIHSIRTTEPSLEEIFLKLTEVKKNE